MGSKGEIIGIVGLLVLELTDIDIDKNSRVDVHRILLVFEGMLSSMLLPGILGINQLISTGYLMKGRRSC